MAYQIKFFGWNNDGKKHDKVWGYCFVDGDDDLYIFWGRRGNKLSFKRESRLIYESQTASMARKKAAKGYVSVDAHQGIANIWPSFYEEFERQLIYAKLSGVFRYGAEPEEEPA